MAIYQISLFSEEFEIDVDIECSDDEFLLDAAEDNGLELPYSCRAGACSTCAGTVEEVVVDQSQQ